MTPVPWHSPPRVNDRPLVTTHYPRVWHLARYRGARLDNRSATTCCGRTAWLYQGDVSLLKQCAECARFTANRGEITVSAVTDYYTLPTD